jgi:hypothetical protein
MSLSENAQLLLTRLHLTVVFRQSEVGDMEMEETRSFDGSNTHNPVPSRSTQTPPIVLHHLQPLAPDFPHGSVSRPQ